MTGLAAVVARELQEWKRVLVAALAGGLLVYLGPLMSRRGDSVSNTIALTSVFVAAAFGFGVALLAGAGLIGRDLAERRMSFFFYKPLSEASVWGGKLLAAVFLAVLSAILTLVPATLVGGGLLGLRHPQAQIAFAILIGGILILVILGNSFYLTLRARSKWVLLDLTALLITGRLLVVGTQPLKRAHALGLVVTLEALFGVLLVLTLLIAGYVGVRRGRIDLRQVHKFHALTAWPVIALLAIAVISYSLWVRSAGAEDLHEPIFAAVAPAGSWMAVSGKARGRGDYRTTLLVNVDNGQTFRMPGGRIPSETIRFSGDGRRAVWFETLGSRLGRGRLTIATLLRKPITQETTIFAPPVQTSSALSHDGSRLALLSGELLTVMELESERALGSARIPRAEHELPLYNRRPHMFFVDPNVVRTYVRSTQSKLRIYEFDIRSRKLEQTGVIETGEDFSYSVSSQGTLRLLRRKSDQLELRDARTGTFIGTLLRGDIGQHRFLSDGRMVVVSALAGRGTVEVFSPAGAREKTIDLGPAAGIRLGGEAEQGKLVVATSPNDPREWQKYRDTLTPFLVDLSSGEIKKIGTKLTPLTSLWHSMSDLPEPGTIGTRLFDTQQGQLVYLDPTTGERRVIAGRGKKTGAAS